MNQLEILRESLGQCDEIILDALLMRNRIVEDIMSYKEANGIPILQPEQEAKQKEWLERRMADRRHKAEVEDVFDSITQNSKKIQARKLFNYNIVLIGFMGAGKSTISEFLKTAFAMDVIEMDQIIAEREGMSISDIFEVYGEQYFRDLETNLLIEMQSRTNVVISCGGGTPMRECNVVEMQKNGRVVLLTAKPETILDRVKDSHDRPLIENNKTVSFIAELMEKRREKYEAAADIVIETDGKDELQICEELIQRLAAYPPGKGDITNMICSYIQRCQKDGVEIKLNHEVTADFIKEENPDSVILATGARTLVLPIEGIDYPSIIYGSDLLEGKRAAGKKVLVVGGGMAGCETAAFLGEQNHEVTVIEFRDTVGADVIHEHRVYLMKVFEEYGIGQITGAKVCRFFEDGVEYETADGEHHEARGYDSVVLSMGYRNYNSLEEQVKAIVPDTYVIGDRIRARRALDATKEAYDVASQI